MKRTQSQAHGQDLAQVAGRAWGRRPRGGEVLLLTLEIFTLGLWEDTIAMTSWSRVQINIYFFQNCKRY